MPTPPFTIEPLGTQDRDGFNSGSVELDAYLAKQAEQDQHRNVATCCLAIKTGTGIVAGFYTLSACHIHLADLDEPPARSCPAIRSFRLFGLDSWLLTGGSKGGGWGRP